jgi:murein DD-endopeptidase MepM/ murein hydrolase activator NlpD
LISIKQQQILNVKKTLSDWLTHRYQLVIRNEGNLAEKFTFSFSYARLIALVAVLLSMLIMCSLTLATTILSKWLNPVYVELENKKKLIQLATAVDALEEQTTQQKKFIALLQNIIAGKEPPANELITAHEEQNEDISAPYSSEQLNAADTLLRSKFEHSELSPSTTYNKPMHALQALFFFAPVRTVTPPFKHSRRHYGVGVVAKEREPMKCMADGIVVFSTWTIATGWAIVIQHNTDLVSIYKHNAALLKKVGNFVRAGEAIAIMGSSGELSAGPHPRFELWYEGKAVNPEHFITF